MYLADRLGHEHLQIHSWASGGVGHVGTALEGLFTLGPPGSGFTELPMPSSLIIVYDHIHGSVRGRIKLAWKRQVPDGAMRASSRSMGESSTTPESNRWKPRELSFGHNIPP